MEVLNYAQLSNEVLATLPTYGTLMEVVAWGRQQMPPLFLQETIALDEYTHEVLMRWRDGLWLVFGSS